MTEPHSCNQKVIEALQAENEYLKKKCNDMELSLARYAEQIKNLSDEATTAIRALAHELAAEREQHRKDLDDSATQLRKYANALEDERERAKKLVELGEEVMDRLYEDGASIVPQLIDNDDNAGQRFREALAAYNEVNRNSGNERSENREQKEKPE